MAEPLNIPKAPDLDAAAIGRRCLVTGGAGYLGRALVRRLSAAGCEVRSLDIVRHQHPVASEVMVGDLRDEQAVRAACAGLDTVFHTAALIKLLSLYRAAERKLVFDVNVSGTENVLRAAKDAGVTAFVHTSSFNVAIDGPAAPADESMPYANARDLYSLSKIAAERSALAADKAGGLRVCALRPGGIWGTDCDSLMIRSFMEELNKGTFKALIGNAKIPLDNTHVENLVDAQLLAASVLRRRPEVAGGQAYFITDGEPMNGMEWFRPLVEGLGHPFPTTWIPGSVMKALAWMLEFGHLLGAPEPKLTVRGMRNLVEGSSLRIDKARRDLGYSPRHTRDNTMPLLVPVAKAFGNAKA